MDTKARRRLPIGLQTFRELREEDCYYVDKTGFIARLLDEGKHYFLSRPRRFGKSLFLDTLKELFEGNEALFTGLHIHDRWDWSLRHPVVRLDFGSGHFGEPGYVHSSAMSQLAAAAQDAESRRATTRRRNASATCFACCTQEPAGAWWSWSTNTTSRFWMLSTHPTSRAPIVTTCWACTRRSNPAMPTSTSPCSPESANSRGERVLRPQQPHRHHPRPALLGHLRLHRGRPRHRVHTGVGPGWTASRIRDWYNWYDGYNWRGAERVYNPFDILFLFDKREFGCYWFESGTPTFLVETLFRRRISSLSLDGMLTSSGTCFPRSTSTPSPPRRSCFRPAT